LKLIFYLIEITSIKYGKSAAAEAQVLHRSVTAFCDTAEKICKKNVPDLHFCHSYRKREDV